MSETQSPNEKNMVPDTAIAFQEFRFLSFEFVSDFGIRISDFPALAFYIADRRESHDRLADSRQFRRSDHFIDILVSGPGFLGQPGP